MNFKNFKDIVLSFIFTKRCRFCTNICNVTDDICPHCKEDMHTIDGDICFNCGFSKLLCNSTEKKHFYESICAPYYYEGSPKKGVILLKHLENSATVEGLANDMVQCIKNRYSELDFDCCAFVPMHKDDEKRRGFNQSELLAKKIAEALEIPCYNLLQKDYRTKSQHSLPHMMRSGNLLGVFSFNKTVNVNIENMRILLCDDIKTTGSTLDECTKTLLFENCAEVRCVTACISYKQQKEKD